MEFLRSLRERFDIVFLDPPYEVGLLEPAVAHLTAFDILNPHGIIVAEHPADRTLRRLGALPGAPHIPLRQDRPDGYHRGGDRETRNDPP